MARARTAKQKAALRRAQMASARKRRGRGHFSRNRMRYGAAAIAGAVYLKKRGKSSPKVEVATAPSTPPIRVKHRKQRIRRALRAVRNSLPNVKLLSSQKPSKRRPTRPMTKAQYKRSKMKPETKRQRNARRAKSG